MQTAVLERKLKTETENYSLESKIGNTPLIRLRSVTKDLPANVEIYAKAEFMNPGGSVKDRAALAMILAGERSGELTRNKTILDATSGNTGIAYAMIGAARGYKVTLTLPKNASRERKRILKLYGAEHHRNRSDERHGRRTDQSERTRQRISRQIFLSRPIQQRKQLASAFRHDRAGDFPPDKRTHNAFSRRTRNDRNFHRHIARLKEIRSENPERFRCSPPRLCTVWKE